MLALNISIKLALFREHNTSRRVWTVVILVKGEFPDQLEDRGCFCPLRPPKGGRISPVDFIFRIKLLQDGVSGTMVCIQLVTSGYKVPLLFLIKNVKLKLSVLLLVKGGKAPQVNKRRLIMDRAATPPLVHHLGSLEIQQ